MAYRLERKLWIAAEHEPVLRRLHAEGRNDVEISRELGHSVNTISHYWRKLDLAANVRIVHQPGRREADGPVITAPSIDPGWDFSRDNLDLPKDI